MPESTTTNTAVNADAFRDAMAAVCTPVTIITTTDGGHPFGSTVSAFASLSVDPPMVLVALDRKSELLSVISSTRRFGVNVLAHHQAALAVNFAAKGGAAKFENVRWAADHELPRLPEAGAFLACAVTEFVDGGDHVVLLGLVRSVTPGEGRPLTYHGRAFGTHASLQS